MQQEDHPECRVCRCEASAGNYHIIQATNNTSRPKNFSHLWMLIFLVSFSTFIGQNNVY